MRIFRVAVACGVAWLGCGAPPAYAQDLQAVVTGMRACAASRTTLAGSFVMTSSSGRGIDPCARGSGNCARRCVERVFRCLLGRAPGYQCGTCLSHT